MEVTSDDGAWTASSDVDGWEQTKDNNWQGGWTPDNYLVSNGPWTFGFKCSSASNDNLHIGWSLNSQSKTDTYGDVNWGVECQLSNILIWRGNTHLATFGKTILILLGE